VGDNALLKEFLLQLGDSLLEASEKSQRAYDGCESLEEYQRVKITRSVLTEKIPDVVSDIYIKLQGGRDSFDFWEFYSRNREVDVKQVAGSKNVNFLIVWLRKVAKYFLGQE